MLDFTMKKTPRNRFRNRFSQRFHKFLNIFTFCSRQSTSYMIENPSYSNLFLISTPIITRSNIYLSPRRIDYNHLKLSYYPTTFTSIDQVCCICQEFETFFFCLRKKNIYKIVGIYLDPRSSFWHLNTYTFFFLLLFAFIYNTQLFICSYATDVKHHFVIFHHYAFVRFLF